MLETIQQEKLRTAFRAGTLRIRSVSPDGDPQWKRVLATHRAEVDPESIWEATTENGPMVLTGGHRVFISPTQKLEMEKLHPGQKVLGVFQEQVGAPTLLSLRRIENRRFMYDLTAEDWHNFVLHRSKVVISNSPDRNYHFRPPEQERTIGQYNRVFGYVWEDYELLCYLELGLDYWNSFPPETDSFRSLNDICSRKPSWRTNVIWAATVHAMFALATNWIHDEFDYSIGGISLSLEKSSKYQSLKDNAEQQFTKATDAKLITVKFIRGLQQPKFGFGVRSVSGDTLVRVFRHGHEEDIAIQVLYQRCHGEESTWNHDLRSGVLQVRAVDPQTSKPEVCPFDAVLQHDTSKKPLVRVSLKDGRSTVFTHDHSLFYKRGAGLQVVEAGALKEGDRIIVWDGAVTTATVAKLDACKEEAFTYDLSVPGPQNFVLSNGILAHNSSFGPSVGRGVLSPRSFVAFAFMLLSQGFLV